MNVTATRRTNAARLLAILAFATTVTACSSAHSIGSTASSSAPTAPRVPPPPNAGDIYLANHDANTVTIMRPNGTQVTVNVGTNPSRMSVAPPGTPNTGTVYVLSDFADAGNTARSPQQTVTVISPQGVATIIPTNGNARDIAIAPAGTPQAGTAYLSVSLDPSGQGAGQVLVVKPDGTTSTIPIPADPWALAIAPAGLPNAGTVYVGNKSDLSGNGSLTVIRPDSQQSVTQTPCETSCQLPFVGPAGAANAGSIYAFTFGGAGQKSVSIIHPDGTLMSKPLPFAAMGFQMAPAGTARAGSIYARAIGNGAAQSLVLTPDGSVTSQPGTIFVPDNLSNLGPLSGTVFQSRYRNGHDVGGGGELVALLPTGKERSIASWLAGDNDTGIAAIAPGGTPHAGTIYLTEGTFSLRAITPDGKSSVIAKLGGTVQVEVAPSGTPNAGTIYIEDHGTLTSTTDGATKQLITAPQQAGQQAPNMLVVPAE